MRSRIAHTSSPLRTGSLPNGNLDAGDVELAFPPPLDLVGWCRFEEQLQRLGEVRAGFGDGVALAGDIELRADGDIAVVFGFDDGGE